MEKFKFDELVKDKLPKWAKVVSDQYGEAIEVEAIVVYPYFLKLLGYPEKTPTQEQLEIARLVMTSFLKRDIVKRFTGDHAQMRLKIKADDKRTYQLTKFKKSGAPINHTAEYKRLKTESKLVF
jgi:hypothetical protein